MSKRTNKLGLTKILCRFGMLLIWLLAAANITLTLQSTLETVTDTADVTESIKSPLLSDILTLDNLLASDAAIQIAGVSISVLHITVALSILMAILATALLAMAIAIIDLRNFQARRSRH